MADNVFNVTSEDVRKLESKESKAHGGQTSKESDSAMLKSMLADQSETKEEKIDRVKAGLPLPDQPPTASDWNSADGTKTDGGSGRVNAKLGTGSANGLREPATAESSARVDGDEYQVETKP